MRQKKNKGFTLIELLVVIAIVGVLSSTVLNQTRTARIKANDAKRISDLRQIRNALELYRQDNGVYPSIGGQTCNSTTGPTDWPSNFKTLMAPYISSLPLDPEHSKATCNATSGWYYYYGYSPSMSWDWNNIVSGVNLSLCLGATNPPPRPIILWSQGQLGGKKYVNECNLSSLSIVNTFYLNKP